MEYFLPFFTGLAFAFIGLIAPAMLNMTAAKISITHGKPAGIRFALGASLLVLLQSGLAAYFAKYLVANPSVVKLLKSIAIFVLLGLAIFFFSQANKKVEEATVQEKTGFFVNGLIMSSLNMLAVPFYLATLTFLETKGWMKIIYPYSLIYVLGSAFGAFSLFLVYVLFASYISKKVTFIATNINYILSGVFVLLSVVTAVQIFI